ncbi:hypothetical protein HQ489_05515 [Candidatus Woesearchaeota archaeon]|nr:hypothetical protein [Candidatus Woesearchaeota archaeon]
MTHNNGLDFIEHLRKKEDQDLASRVAGKIGLAGTVLGTLAFWATSCEDYNVVLFPGGASNENLEYFLGVPALIAAASYGVGGVIGKGVEKVAPLLRGPNEADHNFQVSYDSLADLVKKDGDFKRSHDFTSLQPEYRDALRIDCLVSILTNGEVAGVSKMMGELEGSESKNYVNRLIGNYLETLPVEQLPVYGNLLREDELVRMVNSYVNESSKLEDAECIAKDGRVSKSTKVSLLNDIAQGYLTGKNLEKAEELWSVTKNYDMLKGPLLEAYKTAGNNRKVVRLYNLKTE